MEKTYKLKQNVLYPGGGYLTEDVKTEAEWQDIFGFQGTIANVEEWFEPVLPKKESKDRLDLIIEDIFSRKRLDSYTYKEAARLVAERYVQFLSSKGIKKLEE